MNMLETNEETENISKEKKIHKRTKQKILNCKIQ